MAGELERVVETWQDWDRVPGDRARVQRLDSALTFYGATLNPPLTATQLRLRITMKRREGKTVARAVRAVVNDAL